jgi:hypothetical protein
MRNIRKELISFCCQFWLSKLISLKIFSMLDDINPLKTFEDYPWASAVSDDLGIYNNLKKYA